MGAYRCPQGPRFPRFIRHMMKGKENAADENASLFFSFRECPVKKRRGEIEIEGDGERRKGEEREATGNEDDMKCVL